MKSSYRRVSADIFLIEQKSINKYEVLPSTDNDNMDRIFEQCRIPK